VLDQVASFACDPANRALLVNAWQQVEEIKQKPLPVSANMDVDAYQEAVAGAWAPVDAALAAALDRNGGAGRLDAILTDPEGFARFSNRAAARAAECPELAPGLPANRVIRPLLVASRWATLRRVEASRTEPAEAFQTPGPDQGGIPE
jgi:hypothetical protein